jgi:uncharacterized protein YbjT (DUF2867 family)
MYVVTGASGNTGKIVAKRLLAAGKKVRAIVRQPDKARDLADAGAELVQADLSDRAAFEKALAGAQGLYLLSPPDMGAKDFLKERAALLASVVGAVKAASVPHVVFLSSISANRPSGTGIILSVYEGERLLRESGVPTTMLRAGYFVENWGAVIPAAKGDGVLPSFIAASQSLPMVCTADIGETAAELLLQGDRAPRVVELSGPRDASPNDVAQTLSKILGKPVAVVEPPLDAVVPTFTSFGISPNIAGLFRDMYQGIKDGSVVFEGAPAEARRGKTSLETSLRALAG